MPLNLCNANDVVTIIKIIGKEDIQKRIFELGFLPGTELKIIINNGDILTELKGNRIAIGRNIASKIFV